MYLYLFKTPIISTGLSSPIKESSIGSFQDLENKFKKLQEEDSFIIDNQEYSPIIDLTVPYFLKTALISKTTQEWLDFLSALKNTPSLAITSVRDGYLFTVCAVTSSEHSRLSLRYYSVDWQLQQRTRVCTTVSIKKYGKEVFKKELSQKSSLLESDLSLIEEHLRYVTTKHCIMGCLKQISSSFQNKTFKEDNVEVCVSSVNKPLGRLNTLSLIQKSVVL